MMMPRESSMRPLFSPSNQTDREKPKHRIFPLRLCLYITHPGPRVHEDYDDDDDDVNE